MDLTGTYSQSESTRTNTTQSANPILAKNMNVKTNEANEFAPNFKVDNFTTNADTSFKPLTDKMKSHSENSSKSLTIGLNRIGFNTSSGHEDKEIEQEKAGSVEVDTLNAPGKEMNLNGSDAKINKSNGKKPRNRSRRRKAKIDSNQQGGGFGLNTTTILTLNGSKEFENGTAVTHTTPNHKGEGEDNVEKGVDENNIVGGTAGGTFSPLTLFSYSTLSSARALLLEVIGSINKVGVSYKEYGMTFEPSAYKELIDLITTKPEIKAALEENEKRLEEGSEKLNAIQNSDEDPNKKMEKVQEIIKENFKKEDLDKLPAIEIKKINDEIPENIKGIERENLIKQRLAEVNEKKKEFYDTTAEYVKKGKFEEYKEYALQFCQKNERVLKIAGISVGIVLIGVDFYFTGGLVTKAVATGLLPTMIFAHMEIREE